jgi:hypothetical protein
VKLEDAHGFLRGLKGVVLSPQRKDMA